MTHHEDFALVGRALRPDYYQYFIHYTSAASAGLSVAVVWSSDSIERVRQAFLYEHSQECALILFVTCPGAS